jgi:hypothetical protein
MKALHLLFGVLQALQPLGHRQPAKAIDRSQIAHPIQVPKKRQLWVPGCSVCIAAAERAKYNYAIESNQIIRFPAVAFAFFGCKG